MHELPDDDEYVHRGKGTVEKCIKAVLDFYINLTNDKSSGCKIKSADLYRYITVRDKYTGCAHCKKGKHISRNKQIYGRRNRWIISK